MGTTWPLLIMFGSHDMRHTGFRKLTVANGPPEIGASHLFHSLSCCFPRWVPKNCITFSGWYILSGDSSYVGNILGDLWEVFSGGW